MRDEIELNQLPDAETLVGLARVFFPGFGAPKLVDVPPVVPVQGSLEARLHKAESRYQALVETIPAITFIVSFEDQHSEVYVNPHIEHVLGYTAREWVEDPILWYQRLHPGDRERWNLEFARTITLGDPFKGNYRFLAKDGHLVWIHGEVTLVRDESQRPVFLHGLGYDITETKLAEEVLRRSRAELELMVATRTAETAAINRSLVAEISERKATERELKALVKELADFKNALDQHAIVAITDPRGRITYANDKFCAISKYSRAELLGQDHRLINSGRHSKDFMRGLWSTIKSGKTWQGEICNRARDGSVYWVDTTIVPYVDAGGNPVQFIAIRTDISERKRAEEKQAELLRSLKETNAELDQFAYIVSHDLKAPLRAISTLSNWLAADYAGQVSPAGREQFALMQARVKRMNALIDGILRYSRLGRRPEESVLVDVNQLVREICDSVSHPPGILLRIENDLPTLRMERTRLTQVFENLIGNAVKYMGKPAGEITVGCEPAGNFWKFSVRDTGPGIDSKYFDKIFQIFQTLAIGDENEGTGIGLAIVKKNVELFGGKIWVESIVGKGSAFYFLLPQTNPPAVLR